MNIALPLHTTNISNQDQLLAGCIREDRVYQKRLYETYYGRMMGVCMRYTNDREEALDILHEGFMKVYRNIKKYKPQHSLESWIRRIMVNTAIDHYRKNKKYRHQVDLDHAAQQSKDDGSTPVNNMAAEEIMKLVQQLPPSYRTAFNLYVVEGYNHREIGKLLGISEGTSKSNLAKARGKLQKMILETLPELRSV